MVIRVVSPNAASQHRDPSPLSKILHAKSLAYLMQKVHRMMAINQLLAQWQDHIAVQCSTLNITDDTAVIACSHAGGLVSLRYQHDSLLAAIQSLPNGASIRHIKWRVVPHLNKLITPRITHSPASVSNATDSPVRPAPIDN